MVLNNATYCSMVYPHVSEISSRNKIQALRCASAVIAYISIVFRSSSGWSKIPGVSIIYHFAYLYSVCPTNRLYVVKAYG